MICIFCSILNITIKKISDPNIFLMFQIGSGIKKEHIQLVGNGDIMEIWLTENRKEVDKRLGRMDLFTQERSKMVPYMEKGFSSGHLEMFMMEIGKMER